MSWIQWQRENLPTTRDAAGLNCTLAAPDMQGPRQDWALTLSHEVPWPPEVPKKYRWLEHLEVEIPQLGLQLRSLEELSGLVIRSTPEWLLKVQEYDGYGRLMEPVLVVSHFKVCLETQEVVVNEDYLSVEWELRFGQLDGMTLSCELDAWSVLPEREFFRDEPETPEELAKFAKGEPMLRLMTPVDIRAVTVEMERCGEDPIPLARQRLKEALGIEDTWGERVFWESNFIAMPEHKAVKEPGWRSKVRVDF
jgi:hypothetical protein